MGSLDAFRSDVYSQNGEDGIIAEIMRRLRIERGFFVEFGAWDGRYMSNAYCLAEQGWSGLAIEGDASRFADLVENMAVFDGRVEAVHCWVSDVGEDRLDAILARSEVPTEFDLLSIDIDSNDWHVWSRLVDHRPTVVVIEVNSSIRPGLLQTHRGSGIDGSSFSAVTTLGAAKGYTAVCHTGNVILVRDDRLLELDLPPDEVAFPELLFDYRWIDTGSAGESA